MSLDTVNTLLAKDGLEHSLDQLEIALSEMKSVYSRKDIDAQLRRAIGEDVTIEQPVEIHVMPEHKQQEKERAAIAGDPLLSRYAQVKESIINVFRRAVYETPDRDLQRDPHIPQICADLAAAVTLESFPGNQAKHILQVYMNIVENNPRYRPERSAADFAQTLDDALYIKNMGDNARRHVMRKIENTVETWRQKGASRG